MKKSAEVRSSSSVSSREGSVENASGDKLYDRHNTESPLSAENGEKVSENSPCAAGDSGSLSPHRSSGTEERSFVAVESQENLSLCAGGDARSLSAERSSQGENASAAGQLSSSTSDVSNSQNTESAYSGQVPPNMPSVSPIALPKVTAPSSPCLSPSRSSQANLCANSCESLDSSQGADATLSVSPKQSTGRVKSSRKTAVNQQQANAIDGRASKSSRSPRVHSRNHRHRENDATGPRRVPEGSPRVRTRSSGDERVGYRENLAQDACVKAVSEDKATEGEESSFKPLPLSLPLSVPSGDQPNPCTNNIPTRSDPQNSSYNWQASKVTVKERLSYLFNSIQMADVYFLVGKAPNTLQRIPAHKFVLAIGSAVFDAMFNGAMACDNSEIEIPDVEPPAFLALLRFLYTDEVQIGPETVMTTLYTAKKYAVPALEKSCVDFLKRNLRSDNAFMLLTQARLFDEPQLAALCLETIDKTTTEALNADGFTDIDIDTLSMVLERDTLGIRECKLYNALGRWAQAECVRRELPLTPANQRLVLGKTLYQIRFPLMTVEEFAMGPAQSGLLQDKEVVKLFLHFTVNPKPRVAFLDTPRCCLRGKEQVVSRFCQVENRWGYSGTSDRIRVLVNRQIFVVGYGLYGSIHGAADYAVNIQLIHTESGKTCGQNDTSFQSDGSTAVFRVMFKEPIEMHPNTSYTACATLKGPDSYYGTKGLRKVTHESVSSGKVTFQFAYAAGNNNGTSMEDGQIPEIIFYT